MRASSAAFAASMLAVKAGASLIGLLEKVTKRKKMLHVVPICYVGYGSQLDLVSFVAEFLY